MGELRNKEVKAIRSWIDPENKVSIPVLDYDIIYPITVYSAIQRTMDDGSTTLDDELSSIYRLIEDKQDSLYGGTPDTLMTWSNIRGKVGETPIVRVIDSDPSSRSYQKVASEKAVGSALDLKANASDFNSHARNAEIHITEAERTKWNAMTPLNAFREHSSDSDIHITSEERIAWNAKANQEDFDNHLIDFNNPHNVTAHQVGTYSREEVDEMFESIRESFFNYRNIYYDNRIDQAKLMEYEPDNWNPNYVLAFGEELPEVLDGRLTYFALRPRTDYSTNESQDCMIYIKQPGLAWRDVGVVDMTNGDMVIRYPDTTMCVWVQGRFLSLFSSGSAESGGTGAGGQYWKPAFDYDSDGHLIMTFALSNSTEASDPVIINGPPGYTPVKGVDYNDGASGIGVPEGGKRGDIMVKIDDEDYDTEWQSFEEFLTEYVANGGTIPGAIAAWDDLIDKPIIHQETGDDEVGLMSQAAITNQFATVAQQIEDILNTIGSSSGLGGLAAELARHMTDFNNPHRVDPVSIGAVSNSAFLEHTLDVNNPHAVTAEQVGLGNVNNTADVDKPISRATKEVLDAITDEINNINTTISGGSLVSQVTFNNSTCTLTFLFRDESELDVRIPIIDIFQTISYDEINNELVIVLPDGSENRISIRSLITTYVGEQSANIDVNVEDGKIKATLLPNSVTGEDIQYSVALRGSPTATTQLPSDKSDKIATTKFVKESTIDNLISYEPERALSANMGRILNQTKVSITDVLQIIADSPVADVVDSLGSENPYAALSARMGHELNITKAEKVHTSPSGSMYGRATADVFGHVRASSADPLMDGTSFVGTDNGYYSRGDHRHPTDVSRAPIHFPDLDRGVYRFTGEPRAVSPPYDSYDDRIATTEWVMNHPGFTTISPIDVEASINRIFSGNTVLTSIQFGVPFTEDQIKDKVFNAYANTVTDDRWRMEHLRELDGHLALVAAFTANEIKDIVSGAYANMIQDDGMIIISNEEDG